MTLLQTALQEPRIAEILLDAGTNPLGPGNRINSPVLGSHRDVISMLINGKANIHHPDGSGRTPIRAAVGHVRDAALVRLLVDSGANQSEADSDGRNLLHEAVNLLPEIIKILLESGKSIGNTRFLKRKS